MTSDFDDELDEAVLAELAEHGVDLSQPLGIEFPVTAPDESAARALAEALRQAGYSAEVEFDPGPSDPEALALALQEAAEEEGDDEPLDPADFGPSWSVVVSRTMVPELAELLRLQAEFDRLAEPFGGRSGGWGVTLDLLTEADLDDLEAGDDAAADRDA